MMTRCGHCQVVLQVDDKLAGELGRCPACQNPIRLPPDRQSVAEMMRYELDPSQIPLAQRVLATALEGVPTVSLPQSTMHQPTGQPVVLPPSPSDAGAKPPVEDLDTTTHQDIRAAIQEGWAETESNPSAKASAFKNPDTSGFFDVEKSLHHKPSPQAVGPAFQPGMLAAVAESAGAVPPPVAVQRIMVICSKCKKTLGIAGELAGQLGMCPNCRAVLIIPYHDGTIPDLKQATRNTALFQRTHGKPQTEEGVVIHTREPLVSAPPTAPDDLDSDGLKIVSSGIKETTVQPGLTPSATQNVTSTMLAGGVTVPPPVEPPPTAAPIPPNAPAAVNTEAAPTPLTKKPVPLGVVLAIGAGCLAGGVGISWLLLHQPAPLAPPITQATPGSGVNAPIVGRATPQAVPPLVAAAHTAAISPPATALPSGNGPLAPTVRYESAKSGLFAVQCLQPAPSGKRWLFVTATLSNPGPEPLRLTPDQAVETAEVKLELPDGTFTPWLGRPRLSGEYDPFSGQPPIGREPLVVDAKTTGQSATLAFLVPDGIPSARLLVKGAEPVSLPLAGVMPEDDSGGTLPSGTWEMDAGQLKKSRYPEPIVEAVGRAFKQKLVLREQPGAELLLVEVPGSGITGIAVPAPQGKGHYQMNLRSDGASVQASVRLIEGGKRLLVSFSDKDLYQFTFDRASP